MSLFSCVTPGPPIEVLHMKKRFDEDQSDLKINLTVGGYKVSSQLQLKLQLRTSQLQLKLGLTLLHHRHHHPPLTITTETQVNKTTTTTTRSLKQ